MPENEHLRHLVRFSFNQKKKSVKSQRLPVETYDEYALRLEHVRHDFGQFNSGDSNAKDRPL